ncbi:hypothetical protein OUZ56_030520 [Daphnia magna]|uniref:Uncharacterized protein n=1 Tax=Daphnia magna TaxID=35525 RepID=A0ABQ9ZRJ7_9CRUS|nr:hypothetical protein OUZ56_030520 [Daphnia magna]
MISLEGEEATHKSELTVNRSRKNLSETFQPFPASLSHSPAYLADAQPLSHESHCNFTVLLCDLRLPTIRTILSNGNFLDYKYNLLQSTTEVSQLAATR